jgi:predicted permease
LWGEFRYAARGLAKSPGFTALAVVALGLGIGASTAIFSVVDNILISPFPYRDAGRLVAMFIVDKARPDVLARGGYNAAEYAAIASRSTVFEGVGGESSRDVPIVLGEGTEMFTGGYVTPGTFQFLGVPALVGRTLTPADYRPGAPPVFVMRYKTWVARFESDPAVLGKSYLLDGMPRTLVGVMPARFALGDHDVWMPADLKAAAGPGRFPDYYFTIGRLKPGVPLDRAAADLAVILQQLAPQFPRLYPRQFTMKVETLADYVVGRFHSSLTLVMAAVGLLLLIGCANVANLLLVRSTAREREFAVRVAMGAGRWRLTRQLAVESLLLALAGAVFGCVLAWAGLRTLVAAIPRQIRPAESVVELNATALLFTLGVAVLTALLFGFAPALEAARRDVNEALRSGGRGVGGGFRRARLRGALVVCEVAISLMLLAAAGLLMRSFLALAHVDLGLETGHVLSARIPLPADRYRTADQMGAFYRTLLQRLKTQPGVVAASEALGMPPFGGFGSEIDVAGKTHSERWTVNGDLVSEGYFDALRIPILAGRSFNEAEIYGGRKLAVVNRTFVRSYLGGGNPIGQRVRIAILETLPQPVKDAWFDVIGVAADVRNRGPRDAAQPGIYLPFTLTGQSARVILVRTANDPHAELNALRREIWAVDRGVALTAPATLEENLNENTYAQPRFSFLLLTVFAAVGLVLALVGVYSVMSYVTARQTQEIGIRMALGADRASVLRMVIANGLKRVCLGIAIGLAGALLFGRAIASELWSVSPYDPATLIAVPALLALAGALACWGPARRATLVDPAISLRCE